ncbi:hypothetical protein LCGC14_1837580 [marine sediment metagenome]|uniref:Uncharacterized protein n=1 Tax=marine sediment metagenome TaxID=412755 RepID=A0A0F9H2B8_9ZZZZ
MPHRLGHQEERNDINKTPTRAELLRARQKFNLDPSTVRGPGFGRTQEEAVRRAFGLHQQAFRRRRTRFRETQGLFTTGLNLSRLRALSSIR